MLASATQLSVTQRRRLTRSPNYTSAPDIVAVFEIDGRIDDERLAGALCRLQSRHDALASIFHKREGIWSAEVLAKPYLTPTHQTLPEGADEEEVVERTLNTPLSVERPASAVRYDVGSKKYLSLLFDHLICDGLSLPLITRDLPAAYCGEFLDQAPSYYASALAHESWLQSAEAEEDFSYWRSVAEKSTLHPALWQAHENLGSSRGDLASGSRVGPKAVVAHIAANEARSIHEHFRSAKTTYFAGWLTTLLIAVREVFGSNFPEGVSTPFHGRRAYEDLDTVGYYAYLIPIIFERSGPSFCDTARMVANSLFSSVAHGAVPRWLVPNNTSAGQQIAGPVFMFNVYPANLASNTLRLGDARLRAVDKVYGPRCGGDHYPGDAAIQVVDDQLLSPVSGINLNVYRDVASNTRLALEFDGGSLDVHDAVQLASAWRRVSLTCA